MKNLLSLFQNIYVVHYLRTGFTLIFCLSLSDTLKSEKLASNLNVYVHIYDFTMTCIYTVCNLQCITFCQNLKVRSHPGIWICTGYAPLDAIRICPPAPSPLAPLPTRLRSKYALLLYLDVRQRQKNLVLLRNKFLHFWSILATKSPLKNVHVCMCE